MHDMVHLLPPDYEAVLVKLIAKLPRLEFPKEIHQMNDDVSDRIARVDNGLSDRIARVDNGLTIVDPIAVFNTRNTGHYNMT